MHQHLRWWERSCPHLAKPHLARISVLVFWPNFLLLLLLSWLLPVGACWCLFVPVGACWCLLVPVGACWCLLVLLLLFVCVVCGGCVQDFWASPPDPPLPDRPSPGPPKISLFFFSLPPKISFFLLSGGLLVEFWWCFLKTGALKCARLEFPGCRRGFTGPPTLRPPPCGPPPFGPATLWAPTPSGPHQKQKIGQMRSGQIRSTKIGQIRPNKVGQMRPVNFWPNVVLAKIRFGQMRPNKDGKSGLAKFGRDRWEHLNEGVCRQKATRVARSR